MKTLADVNAILAEFEKEYGFAPGPQTSEAWFRSKLGVVSASNCSKAVAKKDSDTRATYMAGLVAQVCTGIMEEISSVEMEWGRQHEDSARASYEFEHDVKVQQLPFVFRNDSFREGCSPDGFVTAKKGVEIKCPYNSANYIKFFTTDKIKPEYHWQYQFTMRVLDAEEWDFVQYDPRMRKSPLKVLVVKRDIEMQQQMDDMIPAFIDDMDKMLKKIGIKFGDQWRAR